MGNDTSKYNSQQEYIVNNVVVGWDVFKKICEVRCKEANQNVRGLGSWAFGGNPQNEVQLNNRKLYECLLIAKPQPREKFMTFNPPQFTATGMMGIKL